jgi:hypothetical protein
VTGITEYIFTPHAEFEMQRRGIGREVVLQVKSGPEQTIDVRPGRVVMQSRTTQEGRVYLVRVFVDMDQHPAEVVTVYRTSKVSKYWRAGK